MTQLDALRRVLATTRRHLSEAEVAALAGAIGNSGPADLPRDGDAHWQQCREHILAARAALDALLAPPDVRADA